MARSVDPKAGKSETDEKFGDISARLHDLDSRLAAERKQTAKAEKPPVQYQGATDYSKGYRLVSEFVAGVLVGALVGYGLDYVFHTLPLFLIIFLLAGFGAGILNMSRAANRTPPTAEELAKMPKPNDDEDEDK
ncbi:MAG: AtpZ/AtpI family protein [Alphaproteobacteria bacterium]|nr:AtpZ/AtpI family protein [Alphaproteobacteria bacterium]